MHAIAAANSSSAIAPGSQRGVTFILVVQGDGHAAAEGLNAAACSESSAADSKVNPVSTLRSQIGDWAARIPPRRTAAKSVFTLLRMNGRIG
jgi:hypothetical protein